MDCTDELRFPLTLEIDRMGREIDEVTVRVGERAYACQNWEPEQTRDPVVYQCEESGAGTYTAIVRSGTQTWTKSARIEADECHTRTSATLAFELDASTDSCEMLSGQRFWANAYPVFGETDSSESSMRDGSLTGEVAEIMTSVSPGQYPISSHFDASGLGYKLRIRTSLQTLDLDLYLGWPTPIAAVGDTLSVRYSIRTVASNPSSWSVGSIEVRDEAGELLVWMFDGEPSELRPPDELELKAIEGCTFDQGDGPIVRRGLRVTAGDDTTDVAFGEAADVGDFVVLHGNDTDDTAVDTSSCSDCVTQHAMAIAVVRGSRASLAAGGGVADDEDAGM